MLIDRETPHTHDLIDIELAIETLGKAFETAVYRAPESVIERSYRIAGFPVLIRVVGTKLAASVEMALRHLRMTKDEEEPRLTIEVWDDEEVGPLNWAHWPETADTNGTITLSENDRYVMTQRPYSVQLLDRKDSRIIGCFQSHNLLFQDERARPFHRLLSIWLDDRDIQFMHAGLVARGNEGFLMVGKSGSGKSSATIACFLAGFTFLSDDYVALQAMDDGTFVGHSLYASSLADHIERFPRLIPFAYAPNHSYEAKHAIYLSGIEHGRFAPQVQLSAVILPQIVNQAGTEFRRVRPMEAILALAPSSVWILPGSAGLSLDKLGSLVTTVPSYRLELGRKTEQVAPTVERIWQELVR